MKDWVVEPMGKNIDCSYRPSSFSKVTFPRKSCWFSTSRWDTSLRLKNTFLPHRKACSTLLLKCHPRRLPSIQIGVKSRFYISPPKMTLRTLKKNLPPLTKKINIPLELGRCKNTSDGQMTLRVKRKKTNRLIEKEMKKYCAKFCRQGA